ncbi:MAG: hypothetical protein AAFX85_18980 [Pseudomonadota bacterium]
MLVIFWTMLGAFLGGVLVALRELTTQVRRMGRASSAPGGDTGAAPTA